MANLNDRCKDAKSRNRKRREARNLPKYCEIFDDILGKRSVVRLQEVREARPANVGNTTEDAGITANENNENILATNAEDSNVEDNDDMNP